MTLRSAIIVSLICVFAISLAGARNVALQQGRNNDASPDVWGGMHVSLEMNAGGAILEFDCAHGTILQPIKVDAKGEFSVSGTYTTELGGPVQRNNPPRDLPAVYKGRVEGDTMHLEIILADKERMPDPRTLTRGKTGRLVRCQ